MEYDLRPYQAEAVNAVFRTWKTGRGTYIVLPTGTGKTVIFSTIAAKLAADGKRVLIVAHRDELIKQAAQKLLDCTGIRCGIEKAALRSNGESVVAGSVQSLKRKRLAELPEFDAVIIDEAHHAAAATYQTVLEHWPQALILGVTATPDRSDRKSLESVFGPIAFEYTFERALKEGYLAPIRVEKIQLEINLHGTEKNGDFQCEGVADALEPYLTQIGQIIRTKCADRKTVVFLPLRRTAWMFTEYLQKIGVKAVSVDGSMSDEDRERVLNRFISGECSVICNAMLLSEGWDCPQVDCVIVLRPTRSRSLYMQMVGRGTRVCEGKEDLLLLDFLWLSDKYNVCSPADLFESPAVREKIRGLMVAGVCIDDLEALSEQPKKDVTDEREKALAEELKKTGKQPEKQKKPKKLYSASGFYVWLEKTLPAGNQLPVTEAQARTLRNMGIDPDSVSSKKQAGAVIGELISRQEKHMATPGQLKYLKQGGYRYAHLFAGSTVKREMQYLSSHHWRGRPGCGTYNPEEGEIENLMSNEEIISWNAKI